MKVINIFGGPGIGKTTQTHDLMANLKKKGYNVDIIPEYAKKLVYRGALNILKDQQFYVFSKQLHEYRIRQSTGVDIAICESPLPLSIVYNRINQSEDFPYFEDFVWYEYNKFNNLNFVLTRETEYQTIGRTQSEEEAIFVDGIVNEVIKDIPKIEVSIHNFIDVVVSKLV